MDKNMFQRFPKIGDLILSDLDLPTLLNCTMVCKNWNSFLNDPFFWLKKLRDVGQPTEIEISWKNNFYLLFRATTLVPPCLSDYSTASRYLLLPL